MARRPAPGCASALMPPDDPQQRPGDRIAGCRGVAATEQRKAEQCQETECGTERGATSDGETGAIGMLDGDENDCGATVKMTPLPTVG